MTSKDPADAETFPKRKDIRGMLRPNALQVVGRFLVENEWFWAVVFLVAVFSIFAGHFRVLPPPSLPLGAVATRDIRAPFDLQIVDEVATEQKRAEARAKVPPVYYWDSGMANDLAARVLTSFAAARAQVEAWQTEQKAHPPSTAREKQEMEGKLLDALADTLGGGLSRFSIRQMQRQGFSEELQASIQTILRAVEYRKIVPAGDPIRTYEVIHIRDIRRKGYAWDQKRPADSDLITLNEAVRLPGPLVEQANDIPARMGGVVEEYVRGLLRPNLTFNSQETKARLDRAADQVEPLVIFLRKGQVILKAGAKVDESALQKLRAYQESRRNVVNLPLLAALFLFLLMLLAFSFMYLKTYRKQHKLAPNLFVLLLQISLGFLLLSQGIMAILRIVAEGSRPSLLERPYLLTFIIPVAAGALLMTVLVDRHIGVVYTLLFSVLYGIMVDFNFTLMIYCMLSCFTGIFAGSKLSRRSTQWKAGLLIGGVNVALAMGVVLTDPSWTEWPLKDLAIPAGLAFLSGIPLTGMIGSFFLPFFESIFGILTDVRLLELSNMNHPLLRRLAMEAPGTYNHSLQMASLSEAGANAIGANGLFCRVACYYHDVGKMLEPQYYVENQVPGENPHDKLAPRMSALIVSSHVKDGIALARQHKLPERIVAIVPQHHGTRRISYFMDKALTMIDPEKETINEADFRYPGPKPQTREAAIIMIADGVEAGSRVLKKPTHQRVTSLVSEIIQRVVSEGQLTECEITFKDLARLEEAFVKYLMGQYSRRISYPGYTFDKEPKNGTARSAGARPHSEDESD